MIKRNFAVLSVICLLLFLLTGCTTDYDRDDIADYVFQTYGFREFAVSQQPTEVKGEDDYTDYLWTVALKDGSDITFYVKDDYRWGMETMTNSLRDDFEAVSMPYLYEKYGGSPLFRLSKGKRDYMAYSKLTARFTNRDELSALFTELKNFSDFAADSDYKIGISVDFQVDHPLRNRCDYVIDDGDCHKTFWEVNEENYQNALREYLLTCLDYRFEDQLQEFTTEEIQQALSDYNQCIAISTSGKEEGPYAFYDDLCANKYYYGISFATLYEVLLREGFPVSGNSWHYSFTGSDGSIYEISYDFCDYPFSDNEGGIRNGYYYLKNSEQIPMDAYFYNHFSENEVLEMTGLFLKFTDRSEISE